MHYSSMTNGCSATKLFFAASDELQGKAKTTPLPSNIPHSELLQRLCDLFVRRITEIREHLHSCSHDPPSYSKFDGPYLSFFIPVTEELIFKLISESPSKSYTLDPISTCPTKHCLQYTAPLVTKVVDLSLSTCTVPSGLKQTVVTPLLKGSVLGPVLFTLYSQPLSDIISSHGCDYHKDAGDTQVSNGAPPNGFLSAQSNIQTCTSDTLSWRQSNKLKINAAKKNKKKSHEIMLAGSAKCISLAGYGSVDISARSIHCESSVKYLEVHLDQTLSMRQHIIIL